MTRTTRSLNNRHRVRSMPKYLKAKLFKSHWEQKKT